jgi:hypothetical protein
MIDPGNKNDDETQEECKYGGKQMCFNARTKSAVLSIFSEEGILTSMISNVMAMANTPSQNASSREVELVSVIGSFY